MSINNVYAGIEIVCGGGTDEAVTTAIFNSVLQTKNLVSNPSNSETSRTVTQNVTVYNSTFPVKFTRPKLSELTIDLTLTLNGSISTQTVLQNLLETVFTDYINSLNIGQALNVVSIDNVLIEALKTVPIPPETVQSSAYVFTIDGSPASLPNGYLPLEFDQYLTLTTFTLTLVLV